MATYHCLCSTILLATPYPLSSLPRRAAPSLDRAYILPLPALIASGQPDRDDDSAKHPCTSVNIDRVDTETEEAALNRTEEVLPSLLAPALRPVRKLMVVRREDGFEKRRMYRCGRCGISVGYEIEGQQASTANFGGQENSRVLYLFEGGLVSTDDMGKEAG